MTAPKAKLGATTIPMRLLIASRPRNSKFSSVKPLAPKTIFIEFLAIVGTDAIHVAALVKSITTDGAVIINIDSKSVESGISDPSDNFNKSPLSRWHTAPTASKSSSRQIASKVSFPILPVAPFTTTLITDKVPPLASTI